MIRRGELPAFMLNGRPRISPESIMAAESALAVRPIKRKRRETIPDEVARMLET
jgi:hypothetical protein